MSLGPRGGRESRTRGPRTGPVRARSEPAPPGRRTPCALSPAFPDPPPGGVRCRPAAGFSTVWRAWPHEVYSPPACGRCGPFPGSFYAKPPFGGPEQVLAYVGRYTHGVAIANRRLDKFARGQVAFRSKDYRATTRERNDPRRRRVHPPLPAPHPAQRLPSHPPHGYRPTAARRGLLLSRRCWPPGAAAAAPPADYRERYLASPALPRPLSVLRRPHRSETLSSSHATAFPATAPGTPHDLTQSHSRASFPSSGLGLSMPLSCPHVLH